MQAHRNRHRSRHNHWHRLSSEHLEPRLALASITGTVWQDGNGDGIRNPGEWGVAATTVFMDNDRDGILDAGERSAVTDANGFYTFPNTPAGNYNLRTIPNDGWSALPIDRLIGIGDIHTVSSVLLEIDPETGVAFNQHLIIFDTSVSFSPFDVGVAGDLTLRGLAAVPGQPGVYMTQVERHTGGSGAFWDKDVLVARLDWVTGATIAKASLIGLVDPLDRLVGGGVAFDPTGDPRLLYGGFGDTYLINKMDLDSRMWTYHLDTGDVHIFDRPACDCNWEYKTGDIQFDDAGQLYLFGGDNDADIMLLDKTNGQVTQTITAEVMNDAAEYDPEYQAFWLAEEELFRIDPTTGGKTRIGPDFDYVGWINGLELVEGFSDRPVIVSDTDVTAIDFGQVSHVVGISGTVFRDTNMNGELEPRELFQGLQGERVFLDQNGNGLFDAGETYRWTDKLGNYSFGNQPPGIYTIALEQKPLHDTTYPRLTLKNNHIVNLPAGQRYRADFGVAPSATLRGTAYDDTNLSGRWDDGEAGLAGATIYVDLDQNGVLNTMRAERTSAATTAIPDQSSVTSTMVVSGLRGPLADVDVTLDITHANVADLAVTLVSPRGTARAAVSTCRRRG